MRRVRVAILKKSRWMAIHSRLNSKVPNKQSETCNAFFLFPPPLNPTRLSRLIMNRLTPPNKTGCTNKRNTGEKNTVQGWFLNPGEWGEGGRGRGLSFIGADVNPRRDYAILKQNNRVPPILPLSRFLYNDIEDKKWYRCNILFLIATISWNFENIWPMH